MEGRWKITDEQLKKIFNYCGFEIGWGCKKRDIDECPRSADHCLIHCLPDDGEMICEFYYPIYRELDGNDMVAAMNKIVEKKEWAFFEMISHQCYRDEIPNNQFIPWLHNPDNFFNLMEKALDDEEIGK